MSSSFSLRSPSCVAAALLLAFTLSGCSGLKRSTSSLPDAASLASLPVIQLGQAKPDQGDYIVYLPAHQLITSTAKVQGSLFEQTDSKELQVKLKRDVYLYKNWTSFDKLNWARDTEVMGGNIRVTLPGWDHPQAGEVLIEINLKSQG